MKIKRGLLLFIVLAATCLITLAGIWLNGRIEVLPDGGTLTRAPMGVRLTDWQSPAPGKWTLSLTCTDEAPSLTLFFGNSNGPVESDALAGQLPQVFLAAAYRLQPLARQQTVTITVYCAQMPDAWLVPYDTLIWLAQLRLVLQWITLSGMAVMILFALGLYRYKHKSYLLYFLGYAAVMLCWGAIICVFPDVRPDGLIAGLTRLFFSLMQISMLVVSSGLTGILPLAKLPPHKRRPILSGVALAFCALHYLSSGWLRCILICLSMVWCLFLLVRAQQAKVAGAWMLLLGAVITCGTRPLVLFPGMAVSFYPESLPMYMLRGARFCDLPFALSCMFFICRRFALQFDRAEQLNRELDRRVAERTRQLTEQQEARKSMMVNIFHDLRSPLFVMKSCLDTVAAAPDALPKMLPILQERASFMHRLTEDLFLAAKLEQNQILLNEDRVDLCEEAQRVCDGLHGEADKKGIVLSFTAKQPLPVWGDSFRLQQVIQNLVTNAIYYTPAGGRVRVTALAADGKALLQVADTGCGIAPADQAAVFHRYFHTTTQNKHDSSGLGLTIALDLVRLHRGDIQLESQVGKGSTFTVILPLLPDEA